MSLEFTDTDWSALKAEYCKGFTDEQAEVCRTFCKLRGLIPGKHVIFSLRRSKEWDEAAGAKVPITKIIFMTTIDAARLIALRSGEYVGQDQEVYIYLDEHGSPSVESTIPLPRLPLPPAGQTALPREPWAVRTTVYRKSFTHPITSVARFDAYASTYNTANGPQLTEMWTRRAPEMLAKCSEMLSLRKSFPEELSSLYLDLEFKKDNEDEAPHAATPASVVPLPPSVPAVNQQPAEPTNSPRPGEVKIPVPETPTAVPDVPVPENVNQKPSVEQQKAKAVAAVPDLKPASAIPTPKKRGRKPKSPDNGRDLAAEGEITDKDVALAGTPEPELNTEENRIAAKDFVASVTEFTVEEAAAQGLPAPPDPLPSKPQLDGFVAKMRGLVEPGVDIKSLGDYTLGMSGKTGSKYLTVGDWTKAFTELDKSKAEGTLKELLKGKEKPLGQF